MILWSYLGPWSVGTVGWVGVGFGISSAFPNLNESVDLFRAMISGHGGMGWDWIWGSWRSFPTAVILCLYLGPRSVGTVGWVGVEFWDLRCLFQP